MAESSSESSDEDECFIVPIPEAETRQIVSGQAVSDIASAVKELVDNALDAGCNAINIKLFNQGIDVIEVSDNGCGIPADSRPLVAMKHATSKLRTFSSLYEDTFTDGKVEKKQLGFRGEALFSIASISQNLIIMTQTADDKIGQRFEFRRDGYLNNNSVQDVQRKVGTTVAVVKIFDALPVRRADLIKRIKVQRANLLRLMQAYAVLSIGVRFNVVDITGPVGSSKCKQEVKLQTSERSKSLKETVSAVFGSKFLTGLCPIMVDLTTAVSKARKMTKGTKIIDTQDNLWKIEGLVSTAPNSSNKGKTARDIQFFSVNGRPVECPQISKAVSSVWKSFDSGEQKKRPACILCLHLPSAMFDINLVPDKREILITEETIICELLKHELSKVWSEHTGGKFKANEVESQSNIEPKIKQNPYEPSVENAEQIVKAEPRSGKMRRRNACYISFDNIGKDAPDAEYKTEGRDNNLKNSLEILRRLDLEQDEDESSKTEPSAEASGDKNHSHDSNGEVNSKDNAAIALSHDDRNEKSHDLKLWEDAKLRFNAPGSKIENADIQKFNSLPNSQPTKNSVSSQGKDAFISEDMHGSSGGNTPTIQIEAPQKGCNSISNHLLKQFSFQPNADKVKAVVTPDSFANSDSSLTGERQKVQSKVISQDPTHNFPNQARKDKGQCDLQISSDTPEQLDEHNSSFSSPLCPETKYESTNKKRKTEEISEICWDDFDGTDGVVKLAQASRIKMRKARKYLYKCLNSPKDASGSEHKESSFEAELAPKSKTVSLSKDQFLGMNIIGQFNLGFILATCKNNHLWILDQHACDEIYNFEKIFAETKVHEQKLIAPLPLELSPSEEQCVVENMIIFQQNGFKFRFDVHKPVRHRLALTALPHSGSGGDGRKAVQFGKEDVEALCAILGADGASNSNGYIAGSGTGADGGGSMGNNAVRRYVGTGSNIIRLPKSVAMFASRACRKSVMIGDSLSKQEMEQIVKNLHNLQQPWDCPHGRPTIRHIRNLIMNMVGDEDMAVKRAKGPSLAAMDKD